MPIAIPLHRFRMGVIHCGKNRLHPGYRDRIVMLWQLRVFRLLPSGWGVGVGVFLEDKELHIGGSGW